MLDYLLDLTQSEYGFIGEVLYDDTDLPFLRTYAITNIAWTNELKEMYKRNINKGWDFKNIDNLFGLTITENSVIISNDPSNDSRRGGKLKTPHGHPPLNSFLGIPFYMNKTIIGMVGIANRPEGYDQKLVEFLNPFVDTCSTLVAAFRADRKFNAVKDKNNEYISKMSHNLRTPLNAILGYTQMIEMGDIPDQIREFTKIIDQNSHKLLEMINDLLSLSKTSQTKAKIKNIYLPTFITEEIATLEPLCLSNEIKLEIGEIPHIDILADPSMLKQVIENVFSNAVKYNRNRGSISIDVSIQEPKAKRPPAPEPVDDDDDIEKTPLAVLKISDTGKGIGKKDKENVFEPFYRTEKYSHIEGTGLGLHIVKTMMAQMNGNVSLESKLGEGTVVSMSFPYKKCVKKPKCDILYIEDNDTNAQLVRVVLGRLNKMMDIAKTGREGLQKLQENTYKVILLDMGLPDMSGLDIVPHIEKKEQIVVLTADATTETQRRVYATGVKYYLTKPFIIRQLLATIQVVLDV
jgi:signal transduction histidine kinase/CheY-like chemotaxis protein